MTSLLPSETTWPAPPLINPPVLSQNPLLTNKTSSISYINTQGLSPQPIKTPIPSISQKLEMTSLLPSETTWPVPPLLNPPVLSQNPLLTNKTLSFSYSTTLGLSTQQIKTPIPPIVQKLTMTSLLPSETTWPAPPILNPPPPSQTSIVTKKTSSVSHYNTQELSPRQIKAPISAILQKLATHWLSTTLPNMYHLPTSLPFSQYESSIGKTNSVTYKNFQGDQSQTIKTTIHCLVQKLWRYRLIYRVILNID